MPKHDANFPEVYVQPGGSHLVREPVILRTLLSSCVEITFWGPRHGLVESSMPCCSVTRRSRSEVQVELFGSGDVLLVGESSRPTVGKLNCESVLKKLREEGLEVVESSPEDTSGLRIQFNTGTGEVPLKRLD